MIEVSRIANHADARIAFGVICRDLRRPIGAVIIDNDYFDRSIGLADDGFQACPQESC